MSPAGGSRRILHIATRFLLGGAERNIAHFMEWERDAGFDVELAVGADSVDTLMPVGVPIHRLQSLVRDVSPLNDIKAVCALSSLIQNRHYDIVHTHLSKAGIVGRLAAWRHARRIVHTVHMASFGPGYSRAASVAFREAERLTGRVADAIVFVGNDLRDAYLAVGIGSSATSTVIRSPVEIEQFIATRPWTGDQRRGARMQFGIPGNGPLIVMAGVLSRRKRQELAIERLAVWAIESDARIAIAGDGNRAPILAAAESNHLADRVHLLGHVSDMPALMAAADVLVHAAEVEGVPQVVIQALAAGRPVVATEVAGLREVEGGSVMIVPRSGLGLSRAVAAQVAMPVSAADTSAFDPWTVVRIDAQIAVLHDKLS